MIRLHVIVEGQTEETFINQVLAPELWPYEVFPDAHRITTARRRGKVFRGGLTNYQQLRRDILLWILQDRNRDAYFTTMVDSYALPPDFPGYANCRSHQDPLQKVACLESKLQADIDDRRFIPYIQPHEFEALLFSDPPSSFMPSLKVRKRCNSFKIFEAVSQLRSISMTVRRVLLQSAFNPFCPNTGTQRQPLGH